MGSKRGKAIKNMTRLEFKEYVVGIFVDVLAHREAQIAAKVRDDVLEQLAPSQSYGPAPSFEIVARPVPPPSRSVAKRVAAQRKASKR